MFLFPNFANDGAYTVLYTVADGFFCFMPVILGYTAAEKFKLNKFVGMCLGISLVYPTMVALTSGEVLGSVNLGFFGTFPWYSTFFGLPIIMPASGYTSSVIPIILMAWFGSKVEHWVKNWCPQSLKMFFIPMLTMLITVVAGYLVIGPAATLITWAAWACSGGSRTSIPRTSWGRASATWFLPSSARSSPPWLASQSSL